MVLAGSVVPYLYQNLSFSAFYNPSSLSPAKLLKDNQRRGLWAASFLRRNKFSDLFSHLNKTDTDYCFAVVSIRRPRETLYLTQTVARLVSLLLSQTGRTYSFVVYNAAGETHTEAVQLSKIVPVLPPAAAGVEGGGNGGPMSAYERERRDYVAALRLCLQRNATYSIILQDDAVLDWNFFPKLEFVLHYWLPRTTSSWAILKLFYPEKYQDWGNDVSMIVELVAVVLMAGAVQTLLVSMVLPGLLWGRRMSSLALALRLAASIAFILFAILTLGRPHWEELRKLHPYLTSAVPARGCCIPAVLYPKAHLGEVVEYLDSVHCTNLFPVDIALDRFVEKTGLEKYLVVPNIARHIGYLSSLPKGFKSIREFGLLFSEP